MANDQAIREITKREIGVKMHWQRLDAWQTPSYGLLSCFSRNYSLSIRTFYAFSFNIYSDCLSLKNLIEYFPLDFRMQDGVTVERQKIGLAIWFPSSR